MADNVIKKTKPSLSLTNPLIPEEIILYEILPWLPVEHLRDLKFVSKAWYKVISKDPEFKRASQSRNSRLRRPPGLIYRGVDNKYVFLDPSLSCMRVKVGDVKASSNGLLFGTHSKSKSGDREDFYVMNPFTNEKVVIPNTYGLKSVSFGFETVSENPYFALVGMYEFSEKCSKGVKTLGFTVYTSETGEWKKANAQVKITGKCCVTDCSVSQNRTVYIGGTMYWKIEGHVFWLHIKEDNGGTIVVPNSEEDEPKGEIGECNGELSYSMTRDGNLEIWVLRSLGEYFTELTWVQIHCVSLRDVVENCDGKIECCCYVALSDLLSKMMDIIGKQKRVKGKKSAIDALHRVLPFEGGDNVQFWVKHGNGFKAGVIFSYNLKTKTMRILHNSEMERYGVCLLSWKGSLASVPQSPKVITLVCR